MNSEKWKWSPTLKTLGDLADALDVDMFAIVNQSINRVFIEAFDYVLAKMGWCTYGEVMYYICRADENKKDIIGRNITWLVHDDPNRPYSNEKERVDLIFNKEWEEYLSKRFKKYMHLDKGSKKTIDEVISLWLPDQSMQTKRTALDSLKSEEDLYEDYRDELQ